MNFKDYKTNARYAEQINAGYSARLDGLMVTKPFIWNPVYKESAEGKAFQHGWEMADRHEQTNRSEK